MGGSVAMAWSGDVKGILAQALENHAPLSGRKIRILRYAHAAYKQPHQLTRVGFLFSLGYRPDAVINLNGFNEVDNGLQSSERLIHPVYPSAPIWSSILSSRGQDDPELMDLQVASSVRSWRPRRSSTPPLASSCFAPACWDT